jgi:hypothetical protein
LKLAHIHSDRYTTSAQQFRLWMFTNRDFDVLVPRVKPKMNYTNCGSQLKGLNLTEVRHHNKTIRIWVCFFFVSFLSSD